MSERVQVFTLRRHETFTHDGQVYEVLDRAKVIPVKNVQTGEIKAIEHYVVVEIDK